MNARYGQRAGLQWPMRDWSYRAARRRLLRVGNEHLPAHTAISELDEVGNFQVRCACGWHGNGLGWVAHLEEVVGSAVAD